MIEIGVTLLYTLNIHTSGVCFVQPYVGYNNNCCKEKSYPN